MYTLPIQVEFDKKVNELPKDHVPLLLVHFDITTYLPLRALFALPNDKAPWPLCLIGWREAERLSNINDERSAASYYSTL